MEAPDHMLVTTTRQPDIEQTARLLMLAIDLGRGTSHPATAPDDATLDVCLRPCSPKPEAPRYRVAIRAVGTGIEGVPEARIDVIAGNAVAVFPDDSTEDGWGRVQASLHDEAGTHRVVQAAIDACTRLMRGSTGETGTNPQETESTETEPQGSDGRGEGIGMPGISTIDRRTQAMPYAYIGNVVRDIESNNTFAPALGNMLACVPAATSPSRGECVRASRLFAMLACGEDESLTAINDAARVLADALSASTARVLAITVCLTDVLEKALTRHNDRDSGQPPRTSSTSTPVGAAARITSGDYGQNARGNGKKVPDLPIPMHRPFPVTPEEMRHYEVVASLSISLLDVLGTYPDTPEARIVVSELGKANPIVLAALKEGCRRIREVV